MPMKESKMSRPDWIVETSSRSVSLSILLDVAGEDLAFD